MDPITMSIIAALAKLGENVVNDAYQALKAALQHKYGLNSDLAEAVDKLEKKPDSEARQNVLQEEIVAAGADKEPDLLKAAEALIEAIKARPDGEQIVQQIINQNVTGHQNIFSGSGDVTVSH